MVHWVHHVSWELSQDPPVSARGFLNLSPSRLYPADLSAFGKLLQRTDGLQRKPHCCTGISCRIPAAWALGSGNEGGNVSTNLL